MVQFLIPKTIYENKNRQKQPGPGKQHSYQKEYIKRYKCESLLLIISERKLDAEN